MSPDASTLAERLDHARLEVTEAHERLRGVIESAPPAQVHDYFADLTGLTAREVDVLAGIALALPNATIGTELFISGNTVKTYIRLAYAKIGARSRAQAVRWCLLHGIDFDPRGRAEPMTDEDG